MKIQRVYTRAGTDPCASITFTRRASRIVNTDGSVVFEMTDISVPESWSQVAIDILAQKYFRRAGVPARLEKIREDGVPERLQRGRPAAGSQVVGETDSRQVFHRLTGRWTYW